MALVATQTVWHDLIKVSAAGASRIRAKRPEFLRCLKRGGGLFPTPSRGLRGHFPARGAREPFQEQFKRADVRTLAAFPRLARYRETKVRALGQGARGWASGGPRAAAKPDPLPPARAGLRAHDAEAQGSGGGGAEAARAPLPAVGAGAGRGQAAGEAAGARLRAGPPPRPPSSPLPPPGHPPPLPPPSESRALL